MKNEVPIPGLVYKLSRNRLGPYLIVDASDRYTYKLVHLYTNKPTKTYIHADKLKLARLDRDLNLQHKGGPTDATAQAAATPSVASDSPLSAAQSIVALDRPLPPPLDLTAQATNQPSGTPYLTSPSPGMQFPLSASAQYKPLSVARTVPTIAPSGIDKRSHDTTPPDHQRQPLIVPPPIKAITKTIKTRAKRLRQQAAEDSLVTASHLTPDPSLPISFPAPIFTPATSIPDSAILISRPPTPAAPSSPSNMQNFGSLRPDAPSFVPQDRSTDTPPETDPLLLSELPNAATTVNQPDRTTDNLNANPTPETSIVLSHATPDGIIQAPLHESQDATAYQLTAHASTSPSIIVSDSPIDTTLPAPSQTQTNATNEQRPTTPTDQAQAVADSPTQRTPPDSDDADFAVSHTSDSDELVPTTTSLLNTTDTVEDLSVLPADTTSPTTQNIVIERVTKRKKVGRSFHYFVKFKDQQKQMWLPQTGIPLEFITQYLIHRHKATKAKRSRQRAMIGQR